MALMSGCRSGSAANTNANNQPTVIDVTAAPAVIQQIPTYFEATGNLVSDASTDVAPAVAGKIAQVNFDIGSYVNQGDVLIRLDERDAAIRLEQAQAQLNQAQSGVMQAEADDTVIVRVEGLGGVFAQHRAEGIDERLPEAGPVAARPGRQRDGQPGRTRIDGGRLRREPIVELLFPLRAL